MSTTAPPSRGRTALPRAARPMLVGVGIDALGVGLVLPFLVIHLHEVRGIPVATVGVLAALPAVVALLLLARSVPWSTAWARGGCRSGPPRRRCQGASTNDLASDHLRGRYNATASFAFRAYGCPTAATGARPRRLCLGSAPVITVP